MQGAVEFLIRIQLQIYQKIFQWKNCKSVEIWQNYGHNFVVLVFWPTLYSFILLMIISGDMVLRHITRLHHQHYAALDAAYYYRSLSLCLTQECSVCLCVWHIGVLRTNGWTDHYLVCRADSRDPKEPCVKILQRKMARWWGFTRVTPC